MITEQKATSPYRKTKTDQAALEDVEVPPATPSSDEGPRISKRKKKPLATKSEDFLWRRIT